MIFHRLSFNFATSNTIYIRWTVLNIIKSSNELFIITRNYDKWRIIFGTSLKNEDRLIITVDDVDDVKLKLKLEFNYNVII